MRRLLVPALALVLALATAACAGEAPPRAVHILTAEGPVDRILVRYLARGIGRAEQQQAAAVVIRLDTPGGAIDAMRAVVREIEQARVPVIVWVGPTGARAASAGTFVAMAGHLAAMAPGTTIGAATPITATGQDVDGAMGRKVENDTSAFARGVAELRGRNAEWAEQAVREAVSASAPEAVALNVVDFVADDLAAVLAQAEGREVHLAGSVTATIAVRNAPLVDTHTNTYEQALRFVSHPLVVLALFALGASLIWMEMSAPGLFVPGALGTLLMIGALLGLGTLLPQEAAVAAIAVGVVLLGLEIFVPGGILGSIGAVAIILGLAVIAGASTSVDLRLALTIAAIVLTGIGLVLGIALGLLARRYIAPTERTGSARL